MLVAPWTKSRRKRALDIGLGLIALPFAIVLTLVLGLISAAVFRCSPFFIQKRRGVNEDEFSVIKIRSLPKHFAHNRGKHEISHHEFTGWTNFLRCSHLDELPQLLNILSGSMSIVGPRPMIDEVVGLLEHEDRRTRAAVKPGLTGAWQVSTMGSEALHLHPELDNLYVQKASFAGDLRIMLITAGTVFGRSPRDPEALAETLRW